MSGHQLLVSHEDNLGPGGQPRWRATCACGWCGLPCSESNADADAREHGLSIATAALRAQLATAQTENERLRGALANHRALAEEVMAQHDEETTGSTSLDNFINAAMADAPNPTRAALASSPPGEKK